MANQGNAEVLYTADNMHLGNVENIYLYEPNGYHPIILGDVIRSPTSTASYRVLHKLGHGSYSTVWLADHNRSDTTPSYVAVKVSTADGESADEANLLRSVPSSYIVPVFDSFDLDGPNGRHHVIVTETLLCFTEYLEIPRPVRDTKRLIWEIVKSVEHLHKAGLVHGDLYLQNVGVTLPQIQTMTVFDLIFELEDPVLTPTILADMSMSTISLPAYLTAPCTTLKNLYKRKKCEDPLEVHAKLFDFGSVRKENDDTKGLACIRPARSPELLYAINVDKNSKPVIERPSDIWALGTLIFQILSGGKHMFPGGATLSEVVSIAADPPPVHWDTAAFEYPSGINPDTWWSEARNAVRERCENDADCASLIRLLQRIFVFDAATRPTATEILDDEWFALVQHTGDVPKSKP